MVNVMAMDSGTVVLSHRLSHMNMPPMEKISTGHLTLQEILIIGNCSDQVISFPSVHAFSFVTRDTV